MRRKIVDILTKGGYNLECIFDKGEAVNPFRLYLVWYDGKTHRKQVARYANLYSVMLHITNFIKDHDWEV